MGARRTKTRSGDTRRGRMAYLLDQVACSSRRDERLAHGIRFLLVAAGLVVAGVAATSVSRARNGAAPVPADAAA